MNLDVTYRDDANKTRKGTAPQNLAIVKRIAFNTVKKDTIKRQKDSLKIRRMAALMDLEYRDYLMELNFK